MPDIEITTGRLLLQEFQLSDAGNYFALFNDATAMHFVKDLRLNSVEEAVQTLKDIIEERKENRKQYFFKLVDREDGLFVGDIGYAVSHEYPSGKIAEAGYFILPAYWSKGYATEAMASLLQFAFTEGGLHRMEASCLKENRGSERVMQKCGMILEGVQKEVQWHEGEMKDRVLYRLLRSEWNALKANN